MTVCVAAMCEERRMIVTAADKMIGMYSIEAEPDVEKTLRLDKNWYVMCAGDDVSPAFDIVDMAKLALQSGPQPPTLTSVTYAMTTAYQAKRLGDAEKIYLSPSGYNIASFLVDGRAQLGDVEFDRVRLDLDSYELKLALLVVGFDEDGARMFFMLSSFHRGAPQRLDIPGFFSVGSGSIAANHMMAFRELSPMFGMRSALYCVMEAKYFGEDAPGVGWRTDLYVLRKDEEPLKLPPRTVEKIMIEKLCAKLKPGDIERRHIEILNTLPGLDGLPTLTLPPKGLDAETGKRVKKDEFKNFLLSKP